MAPRPERSCSGRWLAATLVTLVVGTLAGPAAAAGEGERSASYAGAPWFRPGQPYSANFPDPAMLRVGGTYYAYSTNTGGPSLPVMSSTDLVTWVARPAYDPGPPLDADPWFNDALPRPARWASYGGGTRPRTEVWDPGVGQFGSTFVAFYAVRVNPGRMCISRATSTSPLGPFVDDSSRPLVCDADPAGSIDPQPFVDPATGTAYLLWKSEGVPGRSPTKLWSRRLQSSGTSFAEGSSARELLRTSRAWEGNVIENPSMVRHGGRLQLFYSANEWRSPHYAVGHAECSSPLGPCTRTADSAVLASRGGRLGPGGASAFVDAAGALRLGYHYWNAPWSDYPSFPSCQTAGTCQSSGQRRLAVEPVQDTAFGPWVGPRPAVAPFSTAEDLVRQQYRDFLGREADRSGLAHWSREVYGGRAPTSVIDSFVASEEFGELVSPTARLYFAYFGRIPDYRGMSYWLGQRRSGAGLGAVSQAFAGSAEFTRAYGMLSDEGFVERVYANVLGRPADARGRAYWTGLLAGGRVGRGEVMTGFSESGEYRSAMAAEVTVAMTYMGMLRRAPDRSGYAHWVAMLEAGGDRGALVGSIFGSREYASRVG